MYIVDCYCSQSIVCPVSVSGRRRLFRSLFSESLCRWFYCLFLPFCHLPVILSSMPDCLPGDLVQRIGIILADNKWFHKIPLIMPVFLCFSGRPFPVCCSWSSAADLVFFPADLFRWSFFSVPGLLLVFPSDFLLICSGLFLFCSISSGFRAGFSHI